MGKVFEEIDDELARFIEVQHVFFVATAPRSDGGLVNLSPKGLDTLRILDPKRVAYLDLTGSGIETVAHLKENGRIVFMFCAFEGRPRILRLHGRGRVFEPGDGEYESLRPRFPEIAGERAIVQVDLQRIADSCGYGVPRYEFVERRQTLVELAEKLGPEKMRKVQAGVNDVSLDGLPGLEPGTR